MAPTNETTTFGASVVPLSQHNNDEVLHPPPTLDSPALTPAVSREDMSVDYSEKPIPIHSPFYQHPPVSFERVHSRQTSKVNVATFEKDLESGHATPLTGADDENPFTSKISVEHSHECKMWPSRKTLEQQRTAEKRRRRERKCCAGCGPLKDWWAKFDKRHQLMIKAAVALFLIGVAIAIGVGISKAVNGSYYGKNGAQQQVGGS